MSDFQHTPGPWSYKETPAGKHKAVDGRGFSIATTFSYSKQDKANAILCAAAPDLLKALDRLVRTIEISGAPVEVGYAKEAINNATNLQP